MKIKFLTLLLMPFFLAGCATPINHATSSGKVEITINGVKKADVKEHLINEMLNRRYTITRSDDALLVFDRPIENAVMAFAYSSKFNAFPTTRVSFNLVQNKNSVRIIADAAAITNPGSGFEQRTNLNNHPDTLAIQGMLNFLQNDLEKAK